MKKKRWIPLLLCLCLITALLPVKGMAIHTADMSKDCTDVVPSSWYVPYVNYVMEKQLMAGTSATTFAPEGTVTRAQYVQVLYALAGKPNVSGATAFNDLKNGAYYINAVNWAAKTGVTGGTSKNTFSPDQKVTREQAATFFYAYTSKVKKIAAKETADVASFPDNKQTAKYAVSPIKWAVGAGMISGVKSGSKLLLSPKGNLTRAQMATMMKAFHGYLGGNTASYPFVKDGNVTRGAWITALIIQLGIDTEAEDIDIDYFFKDTRASSHGKEIEIARGLGFLPEREAAADSFKPDEIATREFVSYTAVRAIGSDGRHSFADVNWSDKASIQYPNEAQVAVHLGMMTAPNNSFSPKNPVDQAAVKMIFDKMRELDSSTDIEEEYDHSTYKNDVIAEPLKKITSYQITAGTDGTYTVVLPNSPTAASISAGSTIVLPKNDKYQAEQGFEVIQSDGKGTLVCRPADPEDIYEKIDISIHSFGDDVTVESAEGVSGKYVKPASGSGELQLNRSVNLGYFEWDVAELEIIKGVKLKGTIKLEVTDFDFKVEGNIGNFKEVLIKASTEATTKLQLEAKGGTGTNIKDGQQYLLKGDTGKNESGHREVGRGKITVYGVDFFLITYLNIDITGNISTEVKVVSTSGYQYKNDVGRWISDFSLGLTAIEAKGSAKMGLGVELAAGKDLIFTQLDLIGFDIDAGPAFDIGYTARQTTKGTLHCADGTAYLYARCGLSKETVVGKFLDEVCHITLEKELFKNDSKNPHKLKLHFENGKKVKECTYEEVKLVYDDENNNASSSNDGSTGKPDNPTTAQDFDNQFAWLKIEIKNGTKQVANAPIKVYVRTTSNNKFWLEWEGKTNDSGYCIPNIKWEKWFDEKIIEAQVVCKVDGYEEVKSSIVDIGVNTWTVSLDIRKHKQK